MGRPPNPLAPADKVALYDALLKTHPHIERKGAANPYTSLNGHMFSILSPTGSLALRLPEDAREAFLKKHRTKLYEAYGVVMKEYVIVPEALLKKTKQLQPYLAQSYAYIQSLNPKRSTRKKEC